MSAKNMNMGFELVWGIQESDKARCEGLVDINKTSREWGADEIMGTTYIKALTWKGVCLFEKLKEGSQHSCGSEKWKVRSERWEGPNCRDSWGKGEEPGYQKPLFKKYRKALGTFCSRVVTWSVLLVKWDWRIREGDSEMCQGEFVRNSWSFWSPLLSSQ